MGLTDLFSKLIVEHGSAEVQAKHIALFKDQLIAADKRIAELESEVANLKRKLENSESSLEKSQEENKILRSKIKEYEQPTNQPSHSDLLEPDKVKLLVFLSTHDWISFDYIPRSLNMNPQIVQFHLDELQESDMVSASYCTDETPEWSLAQEGRRYLIKNNLIT